MPGLVLQPVDQAVATALAQQLTCWARTAKGGIDPLVRYSGDCVSPSGATVGVWLIDAALCDRYGPLPFTSGTEPIDCGSVASGYRPYVIGPGDVIGIDPVTCAGAPSPVTVMWEPEPEVMTGVSVTVAGEGGLPVVLDFGDGTDPVVAQTGSPVSHDYLVSGSWTIRAWPVAQPGLAHSTSVTVKDHAPVVFVYSDPDDDWRALLWVDEPGDDTAYRIDWGDSTGPEMIQRDPPPYPRVAHDYASAGQWTVTVTDTATKRATPAAFETGQIGVLFTFPTDDAVPYLVATRLRVGAAWELDWGDGTPVQTGIVPANASLRRLHNQVLPAGAYTVTVNEVVGGVVRRSLVRELLIPSVFSLQMNVSMSWRAAGDPRTITVVPTDTPPEQTCTVDWGDGTGAQQVAGGTPLEHTYAAIPPGGYLVSVDEDAGAARRFHRLIGEPTRVGVPHLSAWSRWSVEVLIEGLPGVSNADWYGVDWGDGNVQLLAAIGAHWNTWHQYAAPGTYTLRIDAPGMEAPVQRVIVVPTYPQPVVTVAEDGSDPARMTATVTVDNTACGGDVELFFGDGTSILAGESAVVAHQYAGAGAYTVIARCLADMTARGRANIEVPYGGEQTLVVAVGHDSGADLYTARATVTEWTPGKPVAVAWGDGASADIVPPTPVTHQYEFADVYEAQVKYNDNSEIVYIDVTIPFQEE